MFATQNSRKTLEKETTKESKSSDQQGPFIMGKKKNRNSKKQNRESEMDSMTESTSSSNADAAVTVGGNNDTPAFGQQASAMAPVEQNSAGMTQGQVSQDPMMSMLQQVSQKNTNLLRSYPLNIFKGG